MPSTMHIPREGSLLLAAPGSLRIVCVPIAVSWAVNLIVGIRVDTYPVVNTMSQRATRSEPDEEEAETFAINVSGRRTEFR